MELGVSTSRSMDRSNSSSCMMGCVQMMRARVGMVSGMGLAGAMREKFPRWVVGVISLALVIGEHHQHRLGSLGPGRCGSDAGSRSVEVLRVRVLLLKSRLRTGWISINSVCPGIDVPVKVSYSCNRRPRETARKAHSAAHVDRVVGVPGSCGYDCGYGESRLFAKCSCSAGYRAHSTPAGAPIGPIAIGGRRRSLHDNAVD